MKNFCYIFLCVTLLVTIMPSAVGWASNAGDMTPESYLLTPNRVGNLFLTEMTDIQAIQTAFGAANVRTEQLIRQGFEEVLVLVYIEGTGGAPSMEGVLAGSDKILTGGGLTVLDRRFVTNKGIRVGSTFAELKSLYRIDDFAVSAGAVNARSEEAQMSFVLSTGDPLNLSDNVVIKKIRVWTP